MAATVRQANRGDIPAIDDTGRGWVVEESGTVVAFAIGNKLTGNIWALFADPEHEALGYGRRLHEVMVSWLFSHDLPRLWLSTGVGTRAQRFYEAAGWRLAAVPAVGEAMYELINPATPQHLRRQ